MIKHMDRNLFGDFLLETIKELSIHQNFSMDSDFRFKITTNQEPDKNHNSTDDLMRLWMFSDKNIKGRELDLPTIINMLSSAFHSRYPLWVNLSVIEKTESGVLFNIDMSLRFRLPRELFNQETGHPPFKAIY